jgi:hypothetical protein
MADQVIWTEAAAVCTEIYHHCLHGHYGKCP